MPACARRQYTIFITAAMGGEAALKRLVAMFQDRLVSDSPSHGPRAGRASGTPLCHRSRAATHCPEASGGRRPRGQKSESN